MDRRRSHSPFGDADSAPAEPSIAVSKRPGPRGTYVLFQLRGPAVYDDEDDDAAGYEWDFGDGTTAVSDGRWASHVYPSAGEYTIEVATTDRDVATDEDVAGDSDGVTATRTVTVADEPTTLGIVGPDRVGVGETVTLAASVPPELEDAAVDSTWYDYDARRETGGPTFERTFDEPGEYEVDLEATGADGTTETVTRTVTVVDRAPTARIDAPDRVEVGTAVSFDGSNSGAPDGGVAAYAWHDRERDLEVATEGYRCVLDRAGEYTVALTVTGPGGATDTATHTVTVVDGAARTDAVARTDTPDRVGPEGATDATPTDAGSGPTAGEAGPVARIDAPDRVAVGETVAMDGSVSDAPGEVVEHEWYDFEGRPLGVDASGFECSFAEPGDYRYTLTVTDDTGATDTVDHTVTVTDDPAGAAASLVVSRWAEATPRGSYVLFENADRPEVGDSALTHEWDFGDGTSGAVADGPYASHVYDAPGEYTVELTVTDDDGATATDARTVRVGDDRGPVARIDAPDEVTAGSTVTIDGTGSEAPGGVAEYAWYEYDRPEFTRAGADYDSFECTVADPGEYWFRLRVVDAEGRADVARHRLRVLED